MKKLECIDVEACDEAADWASGKTWEEVYSTCHRGDWLLWLFKRTNPDNLRELTLAKGHCANTFRHLMTDKRSLKAVDAAIRYGNNEATDEELAASCKAAYTTYVNIADANAEVYYASYAAYDYTAAVTSNATAYAASNAADYAATDYTAVGVGYAIAVNQKLTADICRKYLPLEIWNQSLL